MCTLKSSLTLLLFFSVKCLPSTSLLLKQFLFPTPHSIAVTKSECRLRLLSEAMFESPWQADEPVLYLCAKGHRWFMWWAVLLKMVICSFQLPLYEASVCGRVAILAPFACGENTPALNVVELAVSTHAPGSRGRAATWPCLDGREWVVHHPSISITVGLGSGNIALCTFFSLFRL